MSLRDNSYSDDEIFMGEMTLQEVKHTLSKHRQTISCIESELQQEEDRSIEIIRMHSEPCLLTKEKTVQDKHLPALSSPPESLSKNSNISLSPEPVLKLKCSHLRNEVQVDSEDDSFLKIEQMVTDMYVSSKTNTMDEVNKTVEVILDNNSKSCNENINNSIDETKTCGNNNSKVVLSDKTTAKPLNNPLKSDLNVHNNTQLTVMNNKNILTPRPRDTYIKNTATPLGKTKPTTLFKTPAPPSQTKGTPLKKPGMTTPYKYVSSPVAAYIKSCPQVPMCKEIKSTLPGKSFIPRPQKHSKTVANKENFNVPPSAYKSANKTKLISTENKQPSTPWTQKVNSSLQKQVITKHEHRVDIKNPFKQQQQDTRKEEEHSCANLTLHQAEVSACTQKPAFSKP